jgi:hypothetical protein
VDIEPLRVFIGYDTTEDRAYRVARESLLDHASVPVLVEPLIREELFRLGAYRRMSYALENGQLFDCMDNKPLSTEFSFSRFLVPALTQWRDWALFCDSDVLFRDDVAKLFAEAEPSKAVQVVQHDYRPKAKTKMRAGVVQETYNRKNWSSVMLFNCAHHACKQLTPYTVNYTKGSWLHQFRWAHDEEIGTLSWRWNVLDGWDTPHTATALYHYTLGTPDVPDCESLPFASEWWKYYGEIEKAA